MQEIQELQRHGQPQPLNTWYQHSPAAVEQQYAMLNQSFGQMTTNVINLQANVQGRAVGRLERPRDVGE